MAASLVPVPPIRVTERPERRVGLSDAHRAAGGEPAAHGAERVGFESLDGYRDVCRQEHSPVPSLDSLYTFISMVSVTSSLLGVRCLKTWI